MADSAKFSFTGSDLCRMQAHEVVALLRRKEVSTSDLLDASFARIKAVGPAINATVAPCPDRAYAAAKALGADTMLGGLPLGIKDLTSVQGVRTTFGTRAMADYVPDSSDPLVERIEARGGIVVGKTNTPELGAGGNTFNDVYGPTRNPWDTRLNAGGSSGGAAASLAVGETWLSHGSDHGGSLRTPAAFCGVVGLRPSPGVAGGSSAEAAYMTEGVQGPMARSVRDCALFLDAMAGFDPRSPISYPAPERPYQDAVTRANGKLRIAFTPDLNGFAPVDPEVEAHLRATMLMLEHQGATVAEHCPDLTGLDATYRTLRGMMWATMARGIDPAMRQHFKQTLEDNMAMGEALTMPRIADANRNRSQLFAHMGQMFATYDVLACPSVGCMPHPQDEEWVASIGGTEFDDYLGWLRFAYLATVTGLPAISVPVGLGPRGLPVGLQLIGKPRGEAALLAAARAVEVAVGVAVGGPLGPIDPNVTHA